MKSWFRAARAALLIAAFGLPISRALTQQSEPQDPVAATAKPEVDTMQTIENAWSQALLKHDQYALEGVLSSSFVDISADGEVTTRNQQIARLFLKGPDATSFEQKVASVRLFGDIAVVNGTYILHYIRDGKPVEDKGIFSHVFQKSHARWQCINSQRTFVVEQAATKKPSTVLPFHFPSSHSAAPSAAPIPKQ